MRNDFDLIVVGGGTAGCVLASRLSEDPSRRVALIEAGRDYGENEPEAVLSPYSRAQTFPEFFWPGLTASLKRKPDGAPCPPVPYMQAKILGGASCVMGMVAMRGVPDDYDDWEAAGAQGWGWKSVLPYYIRLERDAGFGEPLHGASGPIPMHRLPRSEWGALALLGTEALLAKGYREGSDVNGEFEDGVYPVTHSALPHRRITTAAGYLGPSVRRRTNLAIFPETLAERVLFDGRRVSGVEISSTDGRTRLSASEVVVCAGGIHSPAILLRSGVGPAGHLSQVGVPVVADLPGVGSNLLNHPALPVAVRLRRGSRQGAAVRPHIHNMLRYSSGMPGCASNDMLLSVLNRTAWHAVGGSIGALWVAVYKSYSTGTVRLRDREASTYPLVDLALLSDPRDRVRMVDGLVRMLEILEHPSVAEIVTRVFVPSTLKVAAALSRESRANAVLARMLSAAMDVSPWLESRVVRAVGEDPRRLRGMDEIGDFAFEKTTALYHVAGTCRMGAADDPMAVLDGQCRVRDVEGLRVADNSIMPSITRGNTFLPAVMIGERVSDLIAGR